MRFRNVLPSSKRNILAEFRVTGIPVPVVPISLSCATGTRYRIVLIDTYLPEPGPAMGITVMEQEIGTVPYIAQSGNNTETKGLWNAYQENR